MPFQQTAYRELPYTFTDPELMVVAKTLSEKLREQVTIEENKKTAVSQYDGQLKAVKSVVAVLSENIRRGHEYRSIECRVYLDTPRKGFKQIIRTDTWETVGEEHMDYSDRQTVIEWEHEQERQAATATPATDEQPATPATDEQPATPATDEQPATPETAEGVLPFNEDEETAFLHTPEPLLDEEPEHDTAGRENEHQDFEGVLSGEVK